MWRASPSSAWPVRAASSEAEARAAPGGWAIHLIGEVQLVGLFYAGECRCMNTFAVVSEDPDELAKEIMNRYGDQGQRIAPILYSGELELMPSVLQALKANS